MYSHHNVVGVASTLETNDRRVGDESVLEPVDDHEGVVAGLVCHKGLGDCQGGSSVGGADLDHGSCSLGQEPVSQHAGIGRRDKHVSRVAG